MYIGAAPRRSTIRHDAIQTTRTKGKTCMLAEYRTKTNIGVGRRLDENPFACTGALLRKRPAIDLGKRAPACIGQVNRRAALSRTM